MHHFLADKIMFSAEHQIPSDKNVFLRSWAETDLRKKKKETP